MQPIPIGVQNFKTLRADDCYYVDKTLFIKTVFGQKGNKALLITRPRRFGKTLTMTTFDAFLSLNKDKLGDVSQQQKLFSGTEILKEQYADFCSEFMGKFPVLFITLKNVVGNDFVTAYKRFAATVCDLAEKYSELLDSPKLSSRQKIQFSRLLDIDYLKDPENKDVLGSSLKNLIKFVKLHYGIKPVILIDEYDVPLDQAARCGYYDEMLDVFSPFLSEALKDADESFQKAVLTGCLMVNKESIFTGFNNLTVNTVFDADPAFSKALGFTEDETSSMLELYGLSAYQEQVKKNYDGYLFGGCGMYCPNDAVNFCEEAAAMRRNGLKVKFGNYWINTSGNEVIEEFMEFIPSDDITKMQDLIDGKAITVSLNRELSYADLKRHEVADFWTLLIYTGYLTVCGHDDQDFSENYVVRIPNEEIRECFRRRILNFFQNNTSAVNHRNSLIEACLNGDQKALQNLTEELLMRYVSVRDIASKAPKENFYHGFLNGIFADGKAVKDFRSNLASGDGYPDIVFRSLTGDVGVIIEVKYADFELKMSESANQALLQIEDKNYREILDVFGVNKIYAYGFCFCRKACVIKMKELE